MSLASDAAALGRLSPRQREVLVALARTGATTRDLAEQLGMAYPTVKTHLYAIFHRLGVHSRTEAVLIAVQAGLTGDERRTWVDDEQANQEFAAWLLEQATS